MTSSEFEALRDSRREWTKEEDAILESSWGFVPIEQLAKRLIRTTRAVESRKEYLKLGSLYDNGKLYIKDVADIMGVCKSTISYWYKKKGLMLRRNRLRKESRLQISFENLVEWAKNNQDCWDSKNVEIGALGVEEPWLVNKRRSDSKKKARKNYSTKEIKEILRLREAGVSLDKLAAKYNTDKKGIINVTYRAKKREEVLRAG